MRLLRVRPLTAIAVVLFIAGASLCSAQGISAITDPSADVMLSFLTAGRIAEVLAKEGDVVKTDQLLARQDDSVEQIQLTQLRASAEDTTQILAAQATLEQKKVDLKRLAWAAERGAATELEVEHAKLDVRIAELSLKVAEFDHAQTIRKHESALVSVENMRLKSPVSGAVEKVSIEVGESTNALEEVIRIVRTDPLWIDAPVPLNRANKLKVNQTALVNFTGTEGQSAQGKIIFIATAADAASSTLRVRIELPNKTKRPSGEHVTVNFAEGIAVQGVNNETTANNPEN
jgi:RND family efflux transporter MFP subunit